MSEPSFNFFPLLSSVLRRLFFHIKIFRGARQSGPRGWVECWPLLDSPRSDRITRSLAPSALLFIFAFYFRRRCEWSVALGITDMTRDTLLLEFSQVRATPIEEPRVPLCLPSRAKRGEGTESLALFLPPFFCCPFNLSKKEMDSKELNKEDMKMSRGKRERESERGVFSFPAEWEKD